MSDQTFEIIEGGKAIKCLCCNMTSWNPGDVENKYCGHCKTFHELAPLTHCGWCHEPFKDGDPLSPMEGNQKYHWHCGLRMVIGGLNHLNGLCSCCGGTLDPDPVGVSRQEAARMAAQVWIARNPQQPE